MESEKRTERATAAAAAESDFLISSCSQGSTVSSLRYVLNNGRAIQVQSAPVGAVAKPSVSTSALNELYSGVRCVVVVEVGY